MTISTTTNRVTQTGNGVTTNIPFPYAFQSTADIVVVETVIATGVQTTKALTTDYTISGTPDSNGWYPSGATIVANTAPASTVTWTVYRDPAQTQTTDFVDGDPLPASSIEGGLDKVTMLVQRVYDIITRSLRQPEGDSAVIDRLPSAASRASKYLAFDADGDPVATSGTTSSYIVTAFAETLLDDADAATARATLGVGIGDGLEASGSTVRVKLNGATLDRSASGMKIATNGVGQTELAISSQAVIANARNLTTKPNTGTPNSKVDIAADEIVLCKTTGEAFRARTVSVTVDITASGANGLDTGAEASSTWYYLWVISDGTNVAGLLSTSSTAPTMPGIYVYKALVGAVRNNGSSNFVGYYQRDRVVGFASQVVFTSKGAAGTDTYEVLASSDLTAFQAAVPPIATRCRGNYGNVSAGSTSRMAVATDTTGIDENLIVGLTASTAYGGFTGSSRYEVLLSQQNLAWKNMQGTTAENRLTVTGWSF